MSVEKIQKMDFLKQDLMKSSFATGVLNVI